MLGQLHSCERSPEGYLSIQEWTSRPLGEEDLHMLESIRVKRHSLCMGFVPGRQGFGLRALPAHLRASQVCEGGTVLSAWRWALGLFAAEQTVGPDLERSLCVNMHFLV